ncbi:MAG: pyridoxal-phosphate dependent enzyme [Bacteroidota bacterium]
MFNSTPISAIQSFALPENNASGVSLYMLREDLLHPEVSGNKWRKLKYNILKMQELGHDRLVTFGGAFSNHIAATAACAKHHGIRSVGIIRGEELTETSNATLRFAASCGMELIFVNRQDYRQKTTEHFLDKYLDNWQQAYIIPEGGSNALAVKGTAEIVGKHTAPYDFLCVAAGTGGTAAGVIREAAPHQKVLVFPALKGDFIKRDIEKLLPGKNDIKCKWVVIDDYHFGGYAKWNLTLINFINDFKAQNSIALDHIYTGKMLFGLSDLIKNGYFSHETSILVIHTGGTQSIVGFNQINGLLLK